MCSPPAPATDVVNEFEIRAGARVQEHLLAKGSLEAVSVEALCGSLPPPVVGLTVDDEELLGGYRAARDEAKRALVGFKEAAAVGAGGLVLSRNERCSSHWQVTGRAPWGQLRCYNSSVSAIARKRGVGAIADS